MREFESTAVIAVGHVDFTNLIEVINRWNNFEGMYSLELQDLQVVKSVSWKFRNGREGQVSVLTS